MKIFELGNCSIVYKYQFQYNLLIFFIPKFYNVLYQFLKLFYFQIKHSTKIKKQVNVNRAPSICI